MKTLIIAEAGVNHNGDIGLAKEMIAAANETGVDIVKFQTYKAEEVMTDQTPLAGYMKDGDKNFLELARQMARRVLAIAEAVFLPRPRDALWRIKQPFARWIVT